MRPESGDPDPGAGRTSRLAAARALPDCDAFVELAHGLCHYRVDGPADGPALLLVHGATVPAWEFDRLVPHLVKAGFRAVRADLYGHGYSDRPRTVYDQALFVAQLTELLDRLDIAGPVHVIGHSLGAAIAARLTVANPGRIGAVVLAAPMLDFLGNAPAAGLLRWPLVGEALVRGSVVPMLVRRRTRRYRDIEDGRYVVKFRNQLRKPGFGRALLALIRSGALGDQSDAYRALNEHPHPLLMLRGEEDVILTAAQAARILELAPRIRFRVLAGTAHAMMLSHPRQVAAEVLAFLRVMAPRVAGRASGAQSAGAAASHMPGPGGAAA